MRRIRASVRAVLIGSLVLPAVTGTSSVASAAEPRWRRHGPLHALRDTDLAAADHGGGTSMQLLALVALVALGAVTMVAIVMAVMRIRGARGRGR
jgi:hypothetical protein